MGAGPRKCKGRRGETAGGPRAVSAVKRALKLGEEWGGNCAYGSENPFHVGPLHKPTSKAGWTRAIIPGRPEEPGQERRRDPPEARPTAQGGAAVSSRPPSVLLSNSGLFGAPSLPLLTALRWWPGGAWPAKAWGGLAGPSAPTPASHPTPTLSCPCSCFPGSFGGPSYVLFTQTTQARTRFRSTPPPCSPKEKEMWGFPRQCAFPSRGELGFGGPRPRPRAPGRGELSAGIECWGRAHLPPGRPGAL